MRALTAVVAVTAAGTIVACGGSPVERSGDPQLTLSADSIVVAVFQSSPLVATVRAPSGATVSVTLQWISRDERVATVSATGAISAVAAGTTWVVAALPDRPDVRDSVRVRVHADSCSGARPDFGGAATAADRALFAYDAGAPLHLQKTPESTASGVEASVIAFGGPGAGAVTGRMWEPVGREGPRPGMVLMHGLPGSSINMASSAQYYAQHGAVVVAIDAPWNHRTTPPFLTFTDQDRIEQIQVVRDLQRAVDVLRAHPGVDAGRIAYVGFSWGGATGALFVGIERRLAAAALVVGHGGQVSHATGPVGSTLVAGLPCARRVAWIRAMAPIEPVRFVGNANVPLLLQNGRFDEYVPVYEAEELHAAAPPSREVRWYQSGHTLPAQARLDGHRWLHERIGLDAPPGG